MSARSRRRKEEEFRRRIEELKDSQAVAPNLVTPYTVKPDPDWRWPERGPTGHAIIAVVERIIGQDGQSFMRLLVNLDPASPGASTPEQATELIARIQGSYLPHPYLDVEEEEKQ